MNSGGIRYRALTAALVVTICVALQGCDFVRGYAEGRSRQMVDLERRPIDAHTLSIARFVFDDFGSLNTDTLETNALPWKVATAALLLARFPDNPPSTAAVRTILTQFGFIYPQSIENWPSTQQPAFDRPLGMVDGTIARNVPKVRLEVVNTGCAACHAGVTYTADGMPTGRAWIGLPNTSLDLDAFVDAVFDAVRTVRSDRDRVLETIVTLYPDTSAAELRTIRKFVWPRLNTRIAELEAAGSRALPFRNGGPGNTNGVAALKLRLGAFDSGTAFAGTTSIPDLSARTLRSSLLYDGVYVSRGTTRFEPRGPSDRGDAHDLAEIVAFFTVPTMGMRPQASLHEIPRVAEAMRFVESYAAPRFPGVIDESRLPEGRRVYDQHCAQCHGTYSTAPLHPQLVSFPNRLVPQKEMGTDSTRWQVIDPPLLAALEHSAFSQHIDSENTGGYVAPILSGLWATAPYLHNGSVPTLRHLMNPESRPTRFWVGGHRLDFETVGIAGRLDDAGEWQYPDDYVPWSRPSLFDTTETGRSNRGHEAEFLRLNERKKTSLLEFLKCL